MPRIVPSQVVEYLDTRYPGAKKQQESGNGTFELDQAQAAGVDYVLWMLEHLPDSLLTLSGKAAAEFGEAYSAISIAVSRWRAGDRTHILRYVPAHAGLHPFTIVRKCLSQLQDEPTSQTGSQLQFITDTDLRESLLRDLSAIERAFAGGEWKACTVLAGSFIEACLLFAVTQIQNTDPVRLATTIQSLVTSDSLSKAPPQDLNEWTLHPLSEVAFGLSIIKQDTIELCRLAKGYRNLIHPGRAKRLAQACDRGTALTAFATVEGVLRDSRP